MTEFKQGEKALLVGDNPFHSISHLSQDRARFREKNLVFPEYAAKLIGCAVESGANGFMFSVSETTLSILRALGKKGQVEQISLYPIVPYASEYVKLSTQVGGISGLAKKIAKRIVYSGNVRTMATGLTGSLMTDPVRFMKTYLAYEIDRIKSSAGKKAKIESILLHEVITDLALAMNLSWFFKSYVDYVQKLGITPGFNTCNFAYLVDQFKGWDIKSSELAIASPFNKVGFQMVPSKAQCEHALGNLSKPSVIAISILAAGYLRPMEAVEYISTLPNVKGVAVGISKEEQARQTFKLLSQKLTS